MAIRLGDALVALGTDNRPLQDGLAEARGTVDGWVRGTATSIMQGVGQALGQTLFSAAGQLSSALISAGGAAITMGAQATDASRNMQAQLGLTEQDADRLGDVAVRVFGNNFSGSVDEAAGAVMRVRQQLGDLSDQELQRASENVFRLTDAYEELDQDQTISTAKTLMENFGLSADDAFDFISSGMQRGLDRSGDFLDTINEYSTQFKEGGVDAAQFFSFMESGLAGGVLGTDKAADAFKEFRLRINDGSATTADGLALLGMNAEEMARRLADGSLTSADAFQMVTDALRRTDDQTIRMQAGAALLGTQYEDLGDSAVAALSLAGVSAEDLAGATEKLDAQYQNLPSIIEGFKRRALTAFRPVGDRIYELALNAMPLVEGAFAKLETVVVPFLERVLDPMNGIAAVGGNVVQMLRDLFSGDFDAEGFGERLSETLSMLQLIITGEGATAGGAADRWFGPLMQGAEMLRGVIDGVRSFIEQYGQQIVDWVIGLGAAFAAWSILSTVVGFVTTLATAWGALAGIITASGGGIAGIVALLGGPVTLVIGAVAGLVALLAVAWRQNWGDIQGKTQAAWETIRPILENVQNWVVTKVIPAVQALWQQWTTVWWPQIQSKLQEVWSIILAILTELGRWISEELWPVVQEWYTQWTTVWWPQIQSALENTWTIIQEILSELRRWIDEELRPVLEYWYTQWTTVWWPAIQSKLEEVWGIIKPILDTLREWFADKFGPAVEAARSAFVTAWTELGNTMKSVYDNTIGWVIEKIKDFWNWLTGANFSFNFQIPDIPDWMMPGSPIKLHTLLKDFKNDLDRWTFKPQVDLAQMAQLAAVVPTENQPLRPGFAKPAGAQIQIGSINVTADTKHTAGSVVARELGLAARDSILDYLHDMGLGVA